MNLPNFWYGSCFYGLLRGNHILPAWKILSYYNVKILRLIFSAYQFMWQGDHNTYFHSFSLTLAEVNRSLDNMAQGNRNEERIELEKLIRSMSAVEQKWITRIVLKVFMLIGS